MEGQASIGDMIRFSWDKSKDVLFPFNFKRWFKILVIVWLAGAGVQGCSANFNVPGKPARPSSKVDVSQPSPAVTPQGAGTAFAPATVSETSVPAPDPTAVQTPPREEKRTQSPAPVPVPKVDFGKWAVWIVPAVVLGLALMFVFMWLASQFNFILLDVIVTKNAVIREPFHQHRELGNSYFKWALAFAGVSLGVLLAIGLLIAVFIAAFKRNAILASLGGVLGGLLLITAFLVMGIVGLGVHHFVTVIMYREKIPVMAVLKQFLNAGACVWGQIFKYIFVLMGLGILAMIAQAIVSVIVWIGGLIAGAIVVIPGFLLVKALPLLKVPLIILGGLVLIAIILAVMVVIGMVMLPAAIFFRVFALVYLTRLYPECDLLGFREKVKAQG